MIPQTEYVDNILHEKLQGNSEYTKNKILNGHIHYNGETYLNIKISNSIDENDESLMELLNTNFNLEQKNIDGKTPLWCATEKGHFGVANKLMNYGSEVNIRNGYLKSIVNNIGKHYGISANGQEELMYHIINTMPNYKTKETEETELHESCHKFATNCLFNIEQMIDSQNLGGFFIILYNFLYHTLKAIMTKNDPDTTYRYISSDYERLVYVTNTFDKIYKKAENLISMMETICVI